MTKPKNQKPSQDLSSKSIFTLIGDVTEKKVPWEDQLDVDKKTFSSVFIINRFISMNMDYLEMINALQKFTVGQLDPEITYKLYSSVFPQKKIPYTAYIKAKDEAEKVNDELFKLLVKDFNWNKQECISNLKRIKPIQLQKYLEAYGYGTKEIAKIAGIKISK